MSIKIAKIIFAAKTYLVASSIILLSAAGVQADSNSSKMALLAKNYQHIVNEPQWNSDGDLMQPLGFRQWIFIGSPLTPNGLNANKANFPEYHNVYVQPEAFLYYRNHGKWPEGTMMVKELQLTGGKAAEKDGSRYESSGRGYFPGEVNGMDVSVKDSSRFAESKNWGYFNFGHHAAPYAASAKVMPVGACAACHIANATEDMVYMNLYRPIVSPLPLPKK